MGLAWKLYFLFIIINNSLTVFLFIIINNEPIKCHYLMTKHQSVVLSSNE